MINRLKRGIFDLAGALGECDPAATIVITGSPRSGTTLLLETFALLPGYKSLNEPLLRAHVREANEFLPRTYMRPGEVHKRREEFLEEVLRGRLPVDHRWLLNSESWFGATMEHAITRRLVVKFCRLNRMLPWFAERFTVRGMVLVVRHPCAVVASMKRFGQWDKDWIAEKNRPGSSLYVEHLPEPVRDVFRPVLARVRTQVEALALLWCLDHYIPLLHTPPSHPWIIVPYERLVSQGNAELERIVSALGLESTEEMALALRTPSSSVKGSLAENANRQISRWRDGLSADEINAVLSIVDQTGLSVFYDEAAEPLYPALNSLQQPRWRW